jgi:hypothetical protein
VRPQSEGDTWVLPLTVRSTSVYASPTNCRCNLRNSNGPLWDPLTLAAAASMSAEALVFQSNIPFSFVVNGKTLPAGVYSAGTSGTTNGALVQSSATHLEYTGAVSQPVSFNSNVTAGNTIFVFIQYYSAAVTATPSGCGNTFTEIPGAAVTITTGSSDGTGGTGDWYIAKNVNGGPCTITVSYSSRVSYPGVDVFEVSGLGGANVALDQQASGHSTSGATASATIKPNQPNSFVIAQVWSDNGGLRSLGGGWTTQEGANFSEQFQEPECCSASSSWNRMSPEGTVGCRRLCSYESRSLIRLRLGRPRRKSGGRDAYNRKYVGLDHQYYDRDWFATALLKRGLTDVRVEDQEIAGYGNAPFRFNAWALKFGSDRVVRPAE